MLADVWASPKTPLPLDALARGMEPTNGKGVTSYPEWPEAIFTKRCNKRLGGFCGNQNTDAAVRKFNAMKSNAVHAWWITA